LIFGREVAAALLGMPEKTQWKNCELSPEEEEKLVDKLREEYGPYDITQEEV